jgi:hypothetical protein
VGGEFRNLMSLLLICVLIGGLPSAGYSNNQGVQTEERTSGEKEISIEEKWGVKIVGIRLTASDYMLDFRYRVIDPDKAWQLMQKKTERYLIHEATGKKFYVPRTRLGPLRQTAVKPETNREYIIIFANTGKAIKTGDKVTVVMGDFKAENLVVE